MWEKSVATVKARSLGFTLPEEEGNSKQQRSSEALLRVRADGRASEGEIPRSRPQLLTEQGSNPRLSPASLFARARWLPQLFQNPPHLTFSTRVRPRARRRIREL
eukprot:5134842-Pyramimonas_sp.AAC.1